MGLLLYFFFRSAIAGTLAYYDARQVHKTGQLDLPNVFIVGSDELGQCTWMGLFRDLYRP